MCSLRAAAVQELRALDRVVLGVEMQCQSFGWHSVVRATALFMGVEARLEPCIYM